MNASRFVMAQQPRGSTIRIYNASTHAYEDVSPVAKTEEEWKKILTPRQFDVLRKQVTERPVTDHDHHNKKKGVYKCIGCGTDLFSPEHKYDSATGWPSFWQSIVHENVATQQDNSLFMSRTEVHCARCGGHLGHIFDDGPQPTGKRYCINGAVLKFVETP